MLQKAPSLKVGDVIGISSPSFGGAGLFPHRLEQAVRQMERLGYRVRLADNALHQLSHVSDTPANRARDLHQLFSDPEVKAVIAAIGGDHSCQLLPLLDFELIRENPKIFMGFSDISVLNMAIHQQTGLVTFNGPAILTDFAEFPEMFEYTASAFQTMLTRPAPAGVIAPALTWTEEFLDWGTRADQTRPRQMLPSSGWTWLKPGRAVGRLQGGCIESLQHLRGTPYWPDWQGRIFFWETSEEVPTPERLDGILMDYENMGVFSQITGMLVGRPMGYSEEQKQALRRVILERTTGYAFPVITDMDFGHTAPQFVLPFGIPAVIDSQHQVFEILEAAVM